MLFLPTVFTICRLRTTGGHRTQVLLPADEKWKTKRRGTKGWLPPPTTGNGPSLMSLLNTTTTTMAVVTMKARQRCGTKWCSSSTPHSTFSDRFSPAALVARAHSKEVSLLILLSLISVASFDVSVVSVGVVVDAREVFVSSSPRSFYETSLSMKS